MFTLSFGSTYRIPVTQAGVNNSKKEKLRNLVESYPNGLIGKGKTGYARVSVPESLDSDFESKLKKIGYKVFQKFDGHDISKDSMDSFIKEKLDTRDYNQKGKKMKKMSREMKEQRRYERRFTPSLKDTEPADSLENNKSDLINENITETKIQSAAGKPVLKKNKESVLNEEMERIKQSDGYLRLKEAYGEEFANAVYFDLR